MHPSGLQAALLAYALITVVYALYIWGVLEESAAECESCEYHRDAHRHLDRAGRIISEDLISPVVFWATVCLLTGFFWPKTLSSRIMHTSKRRSQRVGCVV